MAPALAVSSFPDWHQSHPSSSRGRQAYAVNQGQSYGQGLIREDNGYHCHDGSLIDPSMYSMSHLHIAPLPRSTKESIASLCISQRSPSPDYSILRPQHTIFPPRSSSLPPRNLAPNSAPTTRAPSPLCHTRNMSSRCSLDTPRPLSPEDVMVFAQRDPDDFEPDMAFTPPLSTHASKPSLTGSDLSQSNTLKPMLSRSSTVSGSSSASTKSPSKRTHSPAIRASKHNKLEIHPYALMGQVPNMVWSPAVPDLYRSEVKKTSKQPRSNSRPESPGSDVSQDNSCNKSTKLGFSRVKLLGLGGRRSRTASPELPSPESATTIHLASRPPHIQDPSVSSTTLVSLTPSSSDGSDLEPKSPVSHADFGDSDVVTHLVIGDVWEKYELHEVIPILRTLKFTGL